MRTVFKYPLKITDQQTISMPYGAIPVAVQFQFEQLCLWAMVDTDQGPEPRTIYIVGTGNPATCLTSSAEYLGTVQQFGGQLVWHVFYEP